MDHEEIQSLIASMKFNDDEISDDQALLILTRMMSVFSSHVWFTINRNRNKYFVCIYYDNMLNRPNGEDL